MTQAKATVITALIAASALTACSNAPVGSIQNPYPDSAVMIGNLPRHVIDTQDLPSRNSERTTVLSQIYDGSLHTFNIIRTSADDRRGCATFRVDEEVASVNIDLTTLLNPTNAVSTTVETSYGRICRGPVVHSLTPGTQF